MRYIDTADRDRKSSVAAWLEEVLTLEVTELRWQSGFFYAEGAGLLLPTLERLKETGGVVHGVIGANVGSTLRDDVLLLARAMGVPRQAAALGVVSFSGGLYHPKTYHARREDGSECAYVGSANLTAPGLSGRNIEGGLIVDTREGDSHEALRSIAAGVDRWFSEERDGLHVVDVELAIAALHEAGILVDTLPPYRETPAEAADGAAAADQGSQDEGAIKAKRPRLNPLFKLPRVRQRSERPSESHKVATLSQSLGQAVPRKGFPDYFLFDATATQSTAGVLALSGSALPSGAVGLIIQLNKDSARHFEGRGGTANISIPVSTLSTFRFGIYDGRYARPRADFDLLVRYIHGDGEELIGSRLKTAVMAYGYADGETGHKDVRMLLPAGVQELRDSISQKGYSIPAVEDLVGGN